LQNEIIAIDGKSLRGSHNKRKEIKMLVRHESATLLAAGSAAEKVLTQHISYPALGLLQ
jgi:hypothetical protein